MIFHSQPDRHQAGILAARLFAIETYLGVGVALLAALRGMRFRYGFLAAGLLLFNEWVLKAIMDQALVRGSALGLGFGPWHGVSALLYLAACLAVAVAVCKSNL